MNNGMKIKHEIVRNGNKKRTEIKKVRSGREEVYAA